jgi:ABC-type multidrug transport system ATPase subunit
MNALVECRDVHKSFGSIRALAGLTFSINNRTSVGLVGPNGAGKTTLFSVISGFLRPDAGTISVLDHRPDSPQVKGRIGILPQDVPMLQGIPVYAQLILLARLQGFTPHVAAQETERIIGLSGISGLISQLPETLSFGQRKRVILAQALIGNPDLVLLDEPTSGLDPVAANDVRALIRQLRAEHTFIISSHNLDEIRNVCDEIIIIDKGSLVRHCTIQELIEHDNYLTIVLENAPQDQLLQILKTVPAIIRITADAANPKKLSIQFQGAEPDQVQFRILELLRQHDAAVVEFSRGSAFTDKVVELVRGH